MEYEVVDLSEVGVDLHSSGPSAFAKADFSSAHRRPDGIISWNPPGQGGVFGGIATQDAAGGHGGERHMDGEELLVVLDGVLRVVLLDDDGKATGEVRLTENKAFLVPRAVWHRVLPEGPCRFLFLGGGTTEIRQAQ
jgi:mannose-6-phosphate isomerase-like protein (cupin superfamily)